MSHSTTMVVLDSPEDVETQLETIMAPYDENLEVEPYPETCWCTGQDKTRMVREARAIVEERLGKTLSDYRNSFHALTPADGLPDWPEHIREYTDALDAQEASMTYSTDPDPECEECSGSGTDMRTYNPLSKWDWYVVGGRWDGILNGKNTIPCEEFTIDHARLTFAILIPGEGYFSNGDMGWFGMVSGEHTSDEDWREKVQHCISTRQGKYVVVVDVHI